jgi:hypothetical protein
MSALRPRAVSRGRQQTSQMTRPDRSHSRPLTPQSHLEAVRAVVAQSAEPDLLDWPLAIVRTESSSYIRTTIVQMIVEDAEAAGDAGLAPHRGDGRGCSGPAKSSPAPASAATLAGQGRAAEARPRRVRQLSITRRRKPVLSLPSRPLLAPPQASRASSPSISTCNAVARVLSRSFGQARCSQVRRYQYRSWYQHCDSTKLRICAMRYQHPTSRRPTPRGV